VDVSIMMTAFSFTCLRNDVMTADITLRHYYIAVVTCGQTPSRNAEFAIGCRLTYAAHSVDNIM